MMVMYYLQKCNNFASHWLSSASCLEDWCPGQDQLCSGEFTVVAGMLCVCAPFSIWLISDGNVADGMEETKRNLICFSSYKLR